jgi:BolA protein
VHASIAAKLSAALAPTHLVIEDESARHAAGGAETHFKVLVVSAAFDGVGLLDRHRRVHALLADELAGGVHALSIRAMTPAQWAVGATPFVSPKCSGGSEGP